ncbi:hypothetical protein JCGZ_25754 [Jatropha curcas]|uniref:C3H1-type domain-containing protein n=1 Tax=Jatropha curcas TaxID=180498 RepID=A0A067JJM3_JATCU|nr:hypothetical protein JCGZ_25754 [Jatropha curcas]
MSTVCAEQHKLYPSHQLFSCKKPFKDLEIPPRKLFSKKILQENPDMSPFDSTLRKFILFNDSNNGDHSNSHEKLSNEDLDPYSSDHFRMYEFKVRRCTRSRSHDWTDCPFAHPGEKARRRDPRKYHYSGAVCPEFRRGGCSRGDTCEFAHGVFECWLHPSRYRTEACKEGKNCKRKICFFAHSPQQLRILPEVSSDTIKYDKSLASPCSSLNHGHCCCLSCHSVISSPTSTLLGMSHISPPLSPSWSPSPPLSPVKCHGFSRYSDRLSKPRSGLISYKDVLTELMSSLEAMNFNDASLSEDQQQQTQMILSPSTSNPSGLSRNFWNGDCSRNESIDEKINNNNGGGLVGNLDHPDLGWVNELLM